MDTRYGLCFRVFAADGYITVNKRGGQFWCIQITDHQLLENIKETIKSDHKINIRPGKSNENDKYRLQIGSIEMCDDLRRLGYGERKTKNLSVPNIPKNYFCHFARGYFDGDGNVWVGNTHKKSKSSNLSIMVMFTSVSNNFLKLFQERFRDHGLFGGCLYDSKKNYSRLQYSILNSLKLYDFMYNRLGTSKLFLQRKKEVFERYKKLRA